CCSPAARVSTVGCSNRALLPRRQQPADETSAPHPRPRQQFADEDASPPGGVRTPRPHFAATVRGRGVRAPPAAWQQFADEDASPPGGVRTPRPHFAATVRGRGVRPPPAASPTVRGRGVRAPHFTL